VPGGKIAVSGSVVVVVVDVPLVEVVELELELELVEVEVATLVEVVELDVLVLDVAVVLEVDVLVLDVAVVLEVDVLVLDVVLVLLDVLVLDVVLVLLDVLVLDEVDVVVVTHSPVGRHTSPGLQSESSGPMRQVSVPSSHPWFVTHPFTKGGQELTATHDFESPSQDSMPLQNTPSSQSESSGPVMQVSLASSHPRTVTHPSMNGGQALSATQLPMKQDSVPLQKMPSSQSASTVQRAAPPAGTGATATAAASALVSRCWMKRVILPPDGLTGHVPSTRGRAPNRSPADRRLASHSSGVSASRPRTTRRPARAPRRSVTTVHWSS